MYFKKCSKTSQKCSHLRDVYQIMFKDISKCSHLRDVFQIMFKDISKMFSPQPNEAKVFSKQPPIGHLQNRWFQKSISFYIWTSKTPSSLSSPHLSECWRTRISPKSGQRPLLCFIFGYKLSACNIPIIPTAVISPGSDKLPGKFYSLVLFNFSQKTS